jgi:ABC-type multidrug transport system fused ATPase/permease subunit
MELSDWKEYKDIDSNDYIMSSNESKMYMKTAFSKDDSGGVQLDVVGVSYSIYVNKKEKKLLKNVSLRLEPGEMCALMGPSGAGKRYYHLILDFCLKDKIQMFLIVLYWI